MITADENSDFDQLQDFIVARPGTNDSVRPHTFIEQFAE